MISLYVHGHKFIQKVEWISPNPSASSKLPPQSCSLEQTSPPLRRVRFYKPPTHGLQSRVSRFQPVETINQNQILTHCQPKN